MDQTRLTALLSQPESPSLEFKREFYQGYFEKGVGAKRQKDEFIKDILSLANGDASTAGEEAHLIFGANDNMNADGKRELFDVVDELPIVDNILQLVNSACDPRLENLECNTVSIDGKRIFVISVPPSPHIFETTRKLETPTQTFSEHVVLTRHGPNITVANAKERAAILELKQLRFAETRNAPPVRFGLAVGAFVGAAIGQWLGKSSARKEDKMTGSAAGALFGGALGSTLGLIYRHILVLRDNLYWVERRWRGLALLGIVGWLVGLAAVIPRLWNVVKDKLTSRTY